MADWTLPTQDRVEVYFKELNNWGRWGDADQRGTVNLITPAKRAAALTLVRTGRTVSLARDIGPQPALRSQPLTRRGWRARRDRARQVYRARRPSADSTAKSDAVMMFGCVPTPQRRVPSPSTVST